MKRLIVLVLAAAGCGGSQAAGSAQPATVQVELEPAPAEPAANEAAGGEVASAEPAPDEDAPVEEGITRIDEQTFRLSRAAFDRVYADQEAFLRGARIIPATEGDKVAGMRLSGIRPSSIYAALGFENGDVVRRINGQELTGVERVLEVCEKLAGAPEVVVDITRGNVPRTLTYRIE